MEKIKLSLTNRQNQSVVDADRLTMCIESGTLEVDEDKIVGLDNFQVEAKRAKVTVRLMKQNQQFNNALIEQLTAETALLPDWMDTVDRNCLVIDDAAIMQGFSTEKLFHRHFTNKRQSWSPAATTGTLYVQSQRLAGIIYQCLRTWLEGKTWNRKNDGFSEFSLDTFCAMMLKMMSLHTDIAIDNTIEGQYNSIDTICRAYLNDIKEGYGEYPESLWGGDATIVDFLTRGWQYVARNYNLPPGIEGRLTLLHTFAYNIIENNQTFSSFSVPTNDEDFVFPKSKLSLGAPSIFVSTEPNITNIKKVCLTIALFFASIIRYDAFVSLRSVAIGGGLIPNNCALTWHTPYAPGTTSTKATFIPFYEMREVALSCDVTPHFMFTFSIPEGQITGISTVDTVETNSDGKMQSLFNILFSQYCGRTIRFCKANSGIQIGKVKTRTFADQTEAGIPVVQENIDDLLDPDKLFQPVRRWFTIEKSKNDEDAQYKPPPHFANTHYDYFIQSIRMQNIFRDGNPDCYLSTAGFLDVNWLYFDYIVAHEELLSDTEPVEYDEVPLFEPAVADMVNDLNLYLYHDYFDRYYTKQPSPLMDLYLAVDVGNERLFTGCVDFASVNITKTEVSFEAIDAIGVLIENVNKLANFVGVAQFDVGDNTTADPRSGTTLRDFLYKLVVQPFPYTPRFTNSNFYIPPEPGLDNKLLGDLDAPTLLLTAIQCAKQILVCDARGRIMLADTGIQRGETVDVKEIDGEIISMSRSQAYDPATFSIDKLRNVAGHASFAPDVVKFYSQVRNLFADEVTLNVYNQQTPLNLLDKIELNGKVYIITSKKLILRG